MQEQIAQARAKYEAAFNSATTPEARQAAREEYERDVREAVHGERKTVAEVREGR